MFDGEQPDQLKLWKQRISLALLATQKRDGKHDTSTWGPYVTARLRGEAEELFEDTPVEKCAVEGGHLQVRQIPEEQYPYKEGTGTQRSSASAEALAVGGHGAGLDDLAVIPEADDGSHVGLGIQLQEPETRAEGGTGFKVTGA